MSLSKKAFEKAKQHALERLTGWATDTKADDDGGILRLREQFKHAFQKIEWKKDGKATKAPTKDKKLKSKHLDKVFYLDLVLVSFILSYLISVCLSFFL